MRTVLAASLLALAGIASANGPTATFSGEVLIGGSESHAFDVRVNVGETETIKFAGDYVLELTVPSFNKSVARLKDATGKVLHTSTATGPIQERRPFIYQVCDSGVLFVSPARNDLPKCSS
jgi:hypothetical protein